jgi:hypothetical protein
VEDGEAEAEAAEEEEEKKRDAENKQIVDENNLK